MLLQRPRARHGTALHTQSHPTRSPLSHARAWFALSRALHANQTAGKLPWRWADCNNAIQYSHEDLLASVLPVYHELLQTGGCRRSSNGVAFTSSATAPEAGLLTFYGVITCCRGLVIWSGTDQSCEHITLHVPGITRGSAATLPVSPSPADTPPR